MFSDENEKDEDLTVLQSFHTISDKNCLLPPALMLQLTNPKKERVTLQEYRMFVAIIWPAIEPRKIRRSCTNMQYTTG